MNDVIPPRCIKMLVPGGTYEFDAIRRVGCGNCCDDGEESVERGVALGRADACGVYWQPHNGLLEHVADCAGVVSASRAAVGHWLATHPDTLSYVLGMLEYGQEDAEHDDARDILMKLVTR